MKGVSNFIKSITQEQIIDIIIAICIIIFFKLLSKKLAYMIVKMFKYKVKNKKKIEENPFFNPLKVFFGFLGIYFAIAFLQRPLNISQELMAFVTKAFKIIATIVFAKGLAQSFTMNANFIKIIKEKSEKDIDDSALNMLFKIIRVVIYVSAGFIVITELGYNLNGLIAGLGISGVIVTLAAQDTAKNLFGGVVIFIDRPFIVGDWIEVAEYEGVVEDITFRSTRVRTFENSLVNIPNSTIANASIINWSKMEKRRYKTKLCLELDTPLEKVNELTEKIKNMLLKHERVADDSIIVKFDEITDDGIQILVITYTDSIDYASYVAEKEVINYKIMQIIKEEKVELAYKTQTVLLKK